MGRVRELEVILGEDMWGDLILEGKLYVGFVFFVVVGYMVL